jgi:membrane fusion protein, multidrug efflux system
LGAVVELAAGLSPNDRVIQNPPDGIGNGAEVRVTGGTSGAAGAGHARSKNEKA